MIDLSKHHPFRQTLHCTPRTSPATFSTHHISHRAASRTLRPVAPFSLPPGCCLQASPRLRQSRIHIPVKSQSLGSSASPRTAQRLAVSPKQSTPLPQPQTQVQHSPRLAITLSSLSAPEKCHCCHESWPVHNGFQSMFRLGIELCHTIGGHRNANDLLSSCGNTSWWLSVEAVWERAASQYN